MTGGVAGHLACNRAPTPRQRPLLRGFGLKSPKGVLVAIGTFNQPTNVTLWAGVPPASFPSVTVTRQLAGARFIRGESVDRRGEAAPRESMRAADEGELGRSAAPLPYRSVETKPSSSK